MSEYPPVTVSDRTLHCAISLYSRKCFSERSAIVWLDVSLGMRPGTLLCREGTAG